jgi:hypothetical protein
MVRMSRAGIAIVSFGYDRDCRSKICHKSSIAWQIALPAASAAAEINYWCDPILS